MRMPMQTPVLVLPQIWWAGTEVELINNALEHTSIEVDTRFYEEKIFYVLATEVVVAGVPGPLNCWVEISPYLSTVSAAYWAASGGGGGALPPTAPAVEAGLGVNGTVHTLVLPWNNYANYARVVVQTPVAAAAAFWAVQVLVAGGSV